ncbi:DUF2577 domain-containing protein [Clostridium sp. OS1-26]|uniref:DUF2577 domain-containing protein n=1 Tax=Clostridium sp. OS1-26 TaxID=3070681 RepID=UPI0027DF140B|nr:DUF2577 domain-containing protein [Clostridium sp. OS1-26]WML35341.1 DUF2577 domain-containing protein [Clostridium sp. OS1-26]
MGIIDIIKKAGLDAVGASNPVGISFGEVLNVEDLQIRIDQKQILSKQFFIIPESLTKYEIDLTHIHSIPNGSTGTALGKLVIREGLKIGDKVLLLRVQGGQQYVILDKVV